MSSYASARSPFCRTPSTSAEDSFAAGGRESVQRKSSSIRFAASFSRARIRPSVKLGAADVARAAY